MEKPDAGLRGLDHYKNRLPRWRYAPRQWLIPLVRWETPYLAAFQKAAQTPTLDSYFAVTANLGTHTFFMIVLPILFWCGFTGIGRGMVHILASGVFFSGFVKDLLCLPRPLSPPLNRITMSGSAALEYGFPSTHSTNAVSVAVYALLSLRSPTTAISSTTKLFLEILSYSYATSIVIGRLYCGMHGFFDVVMGSLLGAALSLIQYYHVDQLDVFINDGQVRAISIIVLIILVLVRVHPEPADDCPCFDDSVAFAGVLCGVEAGKWHFSTTQYSSNTPCPGAVPFDLQTLGWSKTLLRICVGVLVIFAWRGIMKFALLKGLPPIFRVVERLGLSLPRKYFMQASEYDAVPNHIKTDNVMPSVSEIPNFISSISHPRTRSISIGPQSAADAYETLAFRQKRRRDSLSESAASSKTDRKLFKSSDSSEKPEMLRPPQSSNSRSSAGLLPTPASSDLDLASVSEVEHQVQAPLTPNISSQSLNIIGRVSRTPSQDRRENEKEEREIFSQLEKPRVRYDVEVITKLVVYSGIGWIAVEVNPILFHYLGLGMGTPPFMP